MEPTLFTDVEDHMFIAQEESFGPVMIISKFQNGYDYCYSLHLISLDAFWDKHIKSSTAD